MSEPSKPRLRRVIVRVEWERAIGENGPREVEVELAPEVLTLPDLPDLAAALKGGGEVEIAVRGTVHALRFCR